MARLVGRNQQEDLPVHLFCDSIADLPTDELFSIKQSGKTQLMEKNEIEFTALEEAIRNGIRNDIPSE